MKSRVHRNGYSTTTESNKNKHIFFEQFEEAPYVHAVITYFCYIILNLIGRLRDFLRRWNFEKNHAATAPIKTCDFVPLYQDYEAFYTRNLYRRIRDCWNRPISSVPGATMELVERTSEDNNWTFKHLNTTRKVINFGSYNYLGFAQNEGNCADAVEKSITKYGIGVGSPRQESGTHILHQKLEQLVAKFTGQQASIVFPMGFATNSLNLPILVDKQCCVISDELNHTSLILGIRLSGAQIRRFKHNNMENLEEQLREAIIVGHPRTRRPFKKILVVVEGIYSMEGSIVRLPQIIELKKKYKFFIYLDEAHSIGALGSRGKGVLDYFNINSEEIDVAMGTFTKSFGSAGGYIAGSKRLIDYIREKSHSTIYGATMSAPICQQIITSMRIVEGLEAGNQGINKIRQLAWNTQYFRANLHKKGYVVFGNKDSPVVPIIIYTPTKLAAFSRECLNRDVGTVVVGFPATSIILARARFCISASHTKEMIDYTLKVIDEVSDMINLNYSRLPVPEWCSQLPETPNLIPD